MPANEKSPEYCHLTANGVAAVRAVSRRLGEVLDDAECPAGVNLYHVGTPQSQQTVEVLRTELADRVGAVGKLSALAPDGGLRTYRTDRTALQSTLGVVKAALTEPCVIVGHDPQMTWLLHEMAAKVARHSLAPGELMLLEQTGQLYLPPRYVFTPSDWTHWLATPAVMSLIGGVCYWLYRKARMPLGISD